MGPGEILTAARRARHEAEACLLTKDAGAGDILNPISTLVGGLTDSAVPAAMLGIAGPVALGYGGGRLLGHAQDAAEDPDATELQKNDLIAEYQRLKRVAEQNKQIADYQAKFRRTGRYLS